MYKYTYIYVYIYMCIYIYTESLNTQQVYFVVVRSVISIFQECALQIYGF